MSLFKKKPANPTASLPAGAIANYSALAELTLNNITDGVLLIDDTGIIKFANPAASAMVGYGSPTNMIGLDYKTVLRLETTDGMAVQPAQSKLAQAVQTNQSATMRDYVLISVQSERRAAIALTLTPTGGPKANKIITFRDITKELEEEEKQSEFISTASHEMRTPVASIEGYLGLALNPQTATIDDRARQYLDAAHASSQHLGRLFKDLLDVTKLDDGRLKVRAVPVEIVSVVREMAGARETDMRTKHLKYSFGTTGPVTGDKQIEQLVYAAVDLDFLREILDNLIDNAIKYTPDGGEIWVNARGDGDKVLINVTDTGIGVSPEDAGHIFQKFYRVDNSQTRQIGGTGLGLYLVKQRVEAMDGRVWVESAFGDGSTFYVSLPRLTPAEYQKRLLAYQNEQAQLQAKSGVKMPGMMVASAPGSVDLSKSSPAGRDFDLVQPRNNPGQTPASPQSVTPAAQSVVPAQTQVVSAIPQQQATVIQPVPAQPVPVAPQPQPAPPQMQVIPPNPVPSQSPPLVNQPQVNQTNQGAMPQ
jgi:signal transduction histidine kinase